VVIPTASGTRRRAKYVTEALGPFQAPVRRVRRSDKRGREIGLWPDRYLHVCRVIPVVAAYVTSLVLPKVSEPTRMACANKTLVRRTLAEKVIVQAVREKISDPEHVAYVLKRVEEEIAQQRSDLPDALKLKQAELDAEHRRLTNFVDFIGEGRGSQALAKGLVETERRVEQLTDEVDSLRRTRQKVFRAPPVE
jgi:hypothetical protein